MQTDSQAVQITTGNFRQFIGKPVDVRVVSDFPNIFIPRQNTLVGVRGDENETYYFRSAQGRTRGMPDHFWHFDRQEKNIFTIEVWNTARPNPLVRLVSRIFAK